MPFEPKDRRVGMYRLGLEGIWDTAPTAGHKKKHGFEFIHRDEDEVMQAMSELHNKDTPRWERAKQALEEKEDAHALIQDIGQFGELAHKSRVIKTRKHILALMKKTKIDSVLKCFKGTPRRIQQEDEGSARSFVMSS